MVGFSQPGRATRGAIDAQRSTARAAFRRARSNFPAAGIGNPPFRATFARQPTLEPSTRREGSALLRAPG